MQKSLREKAIKIKGKEYVLVSDRVVYFNEHFPNGSIQTELVSDPASDYIIVRARIVPDTTQPGRVYTGYSQAVVGQGFINEVSALENAETSAVGRALAFMGIGVLDSIASANEIKKAEGSRNRSLASAPPFQSNRSVPSSSTAKAHSQESGEKGRGTASDSAHNTPKAESNVDNDFEFK